MWSRKTFDTLSVHGYGLSSTMRISSVCERRCASGIGRTSAELVALNLTATDLTAVGPNALFDPACAPATTIEVAALPARGTLYDAAGAALGAVGASGCGVRPRAILSPTVVAALARPASLLASPLPAAFATLLRAPRPS